MTTIDTATVGVQADSGSVTDSHKDILFERLRRLDTGSEQVSPWSEAMERVRAGPPLQSPAEA